MSQYQRLQPWVVFRNKLVKHDLREVLLAEINRQLESKNIIMTEGRINVMDATPIEAARSGSGKGKDGKAKRDQEAGWYVKADSKGNKKSTCGYSVHTGVDEDGFVHRQTRKAWSFLVGDLSVVWAFFLPE